MTNKCPLSGWLIEDLASIRALDPKPEEYFIGYFIGYVNAKELFRVKCDCGKEVAAVFRGNNRRVAAHKLPKE